MINLFQCFAACRDSALPVTINGAGQTFTASSHILVDVALAVSAVPEPQSYTLMLAGLGVIGMIMLRRAKVKAS